MRRIFFPVMGRDLLKYKRSIRWHARQQRDDRPPKSPHHTAHRDEHEDEIERKEHAVNPSGNAHEQIIVRQIEFPVDNRSDQQIADSRNNDQASLSVNQWVWLYTYDTLRCKCS